MAGSSTHNLLSVANQISKQPPPAIWRSLVTARPWPQSCQNRPRLSDGRSEASFVVLHSSGRGQRLCLRSTTLWLPRFGGVFSLFSFEGEEMLHIKGQLGGGDVFFYDKMNHSSNSRGEREEIASRSWSQFCPENFGQVAAILNFCFLF